MIHARHDYEEKMKTIPEDEPVFLLRAQDMTAAVTVRFWANLQPPGSLKDMAIHHANLMDKWPVKKQADL